jgi:prepilin-type processing-associated H-X9-DG protein
MSTVLRTTLSAGLLALTILPLPLHAEPVVVTSGDVQVSVTIHSARISLAGDGFSLRTGTEDFLTELTQWPFQQGTTLTLGGTWRPTDTRGAQVMWGGVHYPELYVGFSQSGGTFTTPSFVLNGQGSTTIMVPFSFSGFVNAYTQPEPSEGPVISTTLAGTGWARAQFLFMDGHASPIDLPGTDYHLEYVFTNAAAIPEPATVLLVGGGIAALARMRKRRSRARD